jgi:hypothetical protein
VTPRFRHLALFSAILFANFGNARAQQIAPPAGPRPPFTTTLSNNTPLAYGMTIEETSQALGQPLQFVRGRPGDAVYLALRNLGGSGLIEHHDRLFLQFRRGRLAGWKEDYGRDWMWQ